MGRADLIGNGKHHLIPTYQPATDGSYQSARRKNSTPRRAARGRGAGEGPHADAAHRPAAARDRGAGRRRQAGEEAALSGGLRPLSQAVSIERLQATLSEIP